MTDAVSETSSIGATWPPIHTPRHKRLRGFYPEYVDGQDQIDNFIDEFETAASAMAKHPEIDRLSIRVVGGIGTVSLLENVGIKVEAAFPLTDVGREAFVIYTALNSHGRRMSEEVISDHVQLIEAVVSTDVSTQDPYKALVARGYKPKILNPGVNPDVGINMVPQFMELYSRFGLQETEVKAILTEPTNVIAYLTTTDGRIASTALAEKACLDIAGLGTVNIVEISEAVTLPSLERRGLYRNLSGLLVSHLVKVAKIDEQPINAIYGESNLSAVGAVYAARRNGRRFSAHDASLFKVSRPDFGILEQSFKVNDGREIRDYNDFALTYVEL